MWKEHVEGGGDWYDMGEVCELMVIEVGGGGGGAPAPVQGQDGQKSGLPQQEELCGGVEGFSTVDRNEDKRGQRYSLVARRITPITIPTS